MCKRNRISAVAAFLAATTFAPIATPAQTAGGPGHGYSSIPTGAYSVVAEVQAKPGKEKELLAATAPLVQLVRSDPKNLVYFLQEDREKRVAFCFTKSMQARRTLRLTIISLTSKAGSRDCLC